MSFSRLNPALAWLVASLLSASTAVAAESQSGPLTFERDVRPILKAHCFHCHGEESEVQSGLDVRLRRLIEKGGESGPALIPGQPEKSLILQRIRDGEMPPSEDGSKRVPPDQVEILARWIAQGALTARPEPEQLSGVDLITEEERGWWSFQAVRRPEVPATDFSGALTPIDHFIAQRLQAAGLRMAPEADRVTLIRRVAFDLTGLPPEPEAVREFVDDPAPDAFERLVDRLLSSPLYGDRWGRHWLDIAGYSDSDGYTAEDRERPWVWKYRDWVINAFNSDLPLDEFIRQQLAGDEMVRPPYAELPSEEIEKLVATGFLRMAPDGTESGPDDVELARNDVLAETLKIVSSSLLGLTVGCAQCHDHRYDPIPQSDYYRLRAIFEPALDWKRWKTPTARLISLYRDADRKRAAEIEAEAKQILADRTKRQDELIEAVFQRELAKLPEELREPAKAARGTPEKNRTPEQKALLKAHPSLNVSAGSLYLYDKKAADELQKLADQAEALRATKPREEFVAALTETPGPISKTFVFIRGDHQQPGQEVEPAGLTVLHASPEHARLPDHDESLPSSGRRLAWARRLTDGSHPLVARVLVNRVWLHHFGRGLVNTPADFGVLGDRPTHPELLDWLASELVASGWQLKHLHRLIMTSAVYRQRGARRSDSGGEPDSSAAVADPDGALYWQFPLRRLDAETLRDAMLAVSGRLNQKRHGPPVPVMADIVGQFVIGKENLNAGRPGPVIPMKGEEFRRTVFIQARRSRPLTALDTFDLPRMEPNCEKRTNSTVATQSLFLMNSDFLSEMADALADRVRREAGTNPGEQVRHAWQLANCRQPEEPEVVAALEYLDSQTAHFTAHPVKEAGGKATRAAADVALSSLCQLLLSSNEFLYVD